MIKKILGCPWRVVHIGNYFLTAVNLTISMSIIAWASQGDRYTADEGFIQENNIAIIDARLTNLERMCVSYEIQ